MSRHSTGRSRYEKKQSTREYSFQDAKRPLTIHVTWDDIHGAIPGDGRNCVMSRAVRREHNCFDIVIYRTVAYVRKTERSTPLRYQLSQSAHDQLIAWDASGRARPITVTLRPPRNGLKLATLRSAAHKEMAKRSRERVKARKAARHERHALPLVRRQAEPVSTVVITKKTAGASGAPRTVKTKITRLRQTYTKPDPLTLIGVRNGTGARPPGSGRL